MGRLSWIIQLGPMSSQGSSEKGGRKNQSQREDAVILEAEIGSMWALKIEAATRQGIQMVDGSWNTREADSL